MATKESLPKAEEPYDIVPTQMPEEVKQFYDFVLRGAEVSFADAPHRHYVVNGNVRIIDARIQQYIIDHPGTPVSLQTLFDGDKITDPLLIAQDPAGDLLVVVEINDDESSSTI